MMRQLQQKGLSGNPVSKMFFGNTQLSSSQKLDHFTMMAALVAIGYVVFVTGKDAIGRKKRG